MKGSGCVLFFSIILLVPGYAFAQSSDRITLLGNFGDFEKGEYLFIYGSLASVQAESSLILQIINPRGELCKIEQLTPQSNGMFLTESIPLDGRICGLAGNYEIKLFYGQYSKSAKFSVSPNYYIENTGAENLDAAIQLVSDKIDSVAQKTGSGMTFYSERLALATTQPSGNTIQILEELYVDLWDEFFIEDEIYQIDPSYRPPIEDALAATAGLVSSNKLSFDIAKSIDRETFAAIFYSQLGDTKKAIEKLNDVFVLISNADPIKVSQKRQKSFAELEESLLNLMKKSPYIMSKQVKEEAYFIFARGTAPLYSAEIDELLQLLSESRYLDTVSRNTDPLYRLVIGEWESKKLSLEAKESIAKLLEQKDKVDKLYQASLLLRQLDKVDRFISSDAQQNSELANLILPEWDDLQSKLELASSVDSILESEDDIHTMKNVIDASSRISKAIQISRDTRLDEGLIDAWEGLLIQVKDASSIDQILEIVSEFDKSLTELRQKRNPLSILKFEYEAMKAKAELQADNANLFTINNALKIIGTAQKMEQGNPSVTKIDRIEVLLAWAAAKAPEIKAELSSYTKDAYKMRASDVLQRAKSIENLVDLSMRKNRFLPGYTDFTNSLKDRIGDARQLIIVNDLDAADNLVRQLFVEWQEVSGAYETDPYGSKNGYTLDELKRIEYRKTLDAISGAVSHFYNADFAPHSDEFAKLLTRASDLVDQGNFLGAESKIKELNQYLRSYLALNSDKIIFNTKYDQENEFWVLQGYVDKPESLDRRERIFVTVYSMDGQPHTNMKFYDTKHGKFFTQWHEPVEPGLYVIMLQYQNSKASQIVSVEERTDYAYSSSELGRVKLSEDFEQLKDFIEAFGGKNLEYNEAKFDYVFDEITNALAKNDMEQADAELSELKGLIERYLPVRSRSAVVEANYNDDKLFISGAVQKTLSFSEDLYVDVYDQRGNHIYEIALKDTSSGKFDEILSKPFMPGMYVAQLQYHDLIVTDFFHVAA